jgi:hypothetical protein
MMDLLQVLLWISNKVTSSRLARRNKLLNSSRRRFLHLPVHPILFGPDILQNTPQSMKVMQIAVFWDVTPRSLTEIY